MTVRSARAFAPLAVALACGCAVGPNYQRPEVSAPAEYRGQVDAVQAASLADLPWWQVFQDPALESLVASSLESNYDLLTATARVEQARAGVGLARSQFFPQIGYEAQGGRTRLPVTAIPDGSETFNSFLGAFQLAWEIDLWGRVRRSTEAARADLLAAQDFRRGVLLTLVGDVARAYFDLIALDRQLAIAREATVAFGETLELFTRRFEGGAASRLEVERADAALADAAAHIPELEAAAVAKENQISVLLGRPPGPVPRGAALDEQRLPPATPPGLPSSLLERRPDIQQAEQQIVATNALVGAAKADFFPRIGLTAFYGGTSTALGNLLNGSASLWSVAGSMAGPLFTGGQRLSQYRGRKAGWQEAQAQYQQAVVTAFAEVSDVLTAQQKLVEERALRERQVAALRESVQLSRVRYLQGLSSYFEVLDAQQRLFPAELDLAGVQRDQLVAVVDLYRALGGGWELGQSWQRPAPTPGP